MKTQSLLLIGVGGQGALLFSNILAAGLMQCGHDVKMSEIHGMAQRGGSVTTQIRFGQKVYAPGIGLGEADYVAAFEKMEALRALPFLKRGGTLVVNNHEIYSMPIASGKEQYPDDALELLKAATPSTLVINAEEIATQLGNPRVQNVVLLGALVRAMNLPKVDWNACISQMVPAKAKEVNLQAFTRGFELST
ncbi:indolepyruvate oxidoreductase subunit beta [Desulfovibrio sp. 86]|uniref:Indolepyruvate oxidoreductase subunit IorB n=1 Tax=uncultured Desulfovibrio sp. TaxID=167968 RepID=A0A212L278_9BACT|nr:indolepyruvate oxidoreductase subunit beta [Desulfovibrio sp. 86]SCM71653.1 Indolepyruvate oxidoreductase subunit IorB [uncultured Desulfovibrio sp.]VZH33007.1 Indolepyruvate oxidoreductase subunit IorB [Desulfovibrio sp. 86]